MPEPLFRLLILGLVSLVILALVQSGRLFVNHQQRMALTAAPLKSATGKVQVLAFSSVDCTQCHTLQKPALSRLQALRGDEIDIIEIDAPSTPELTRRYRILTLPSTVVLTPSGEPHAINYGFAPLQKLQQQIQELCTSQECAEEDLTSVALYQQ